MDVLQIVRKVAVFRNATDDDIRAIVQMGVLRHIEEEEYFFWQGDPAERLYIMLEGRAKLCQISSDGQQVNLRTLVPGQLFGAVGAVDAQAVYPACAQALVNSTALSIESAAFHRLIEERPQLSFGLMRLMTGYIQEMQERYREMATERVEQRVARALLRLVNLSGEKIPEKGIVLSLSRQNLAEMSGTTLFTASRVLSLWERNGVIEAGREKVTIKMPHELVRIAEGLER